MTILESISTKITEAMKAGDQFSLDTLRMAKTALQNATIAKDDHALTEADEISILQKEVKKRSDAATMYQTGGRPELAQKEQKEAALLEQFVPQQLSDDEITEELRRVISQIGAASAADTGKVMAAVMPKFKGRADGARVTGILRTLLQ